MRMEVDQHMTKNEIEALLRAIPCKKCGGPYEHYRHSSEGSCLYDFDYSAIADALHAAWERESRLDRLDIRAAFEARDAIQERAAAAEIRLTRADGALADAATVPTRDIERGIRLLTEQRDAAEARVRALAQEIDEWKLLTESAEYKVGVAKARVKEMEQWVSDLQSGLYINCVYCGFRYGPGESTPATLPEAGETLAGAALREHIAQCPDHPMSKLQARLATLRGAAACVTRAYPFHPLVESRALWDAIESLDAALAADKDGKA